MPRITPNLWFDGNAEQAAHFYAALFPDSHVDAVIAAPAENPSTSKGEIVLVEFTLCGQPFVAINGGPQFRFTEAVSFAYECADQAELDHYWSALIAEGGSAGQCGWCKDRFGLSWQITPARLREMFQSTDRAAAERATAAMLGMQKIDIAILEAAYAGRLS
ncbi:MAG: VOC family protein [Gammaproteobacteria bacterium]|nr:VOC family protein [Gammaproteobacteria bacterium]